MSPVAARSVNMKETMEMEGRVDKVRRNLKEA